MRTTLFLTLVFCLALVSAQTLVEEPSVCDDGSLNTTNCNPCAIQANIDTCKAQGPFHECSATQCDGTCSFECRCGVMCPMIFRECECGEGFRCGRAACSCAQVCIPVQTCSYKGMTFQDGESFTDDCNQCSCNNGIVACTEKACLPQTCPNGKTWTNICKDACISASCLEGSDCTTDHCNNCQAKCVDNSCTWKGKKISNNMPFIDGCKHCICENGQVSCDRTRCTLPVCPAGKKFQQVCEDQCALVRVKCAEPDVIGCQIDQCDKCKMKTCQPRPCATLYDCDADLGQVCFFKNTFDRSVAGVCRSFPECNKRNQCVAGSTSVINKTNGKCYCIPNQVSTQGLEFEAVEVVEPNTNAASATSALVGMVATVAAVAAL